MSLVRMIEGENRFLHESIIRSVFGVCNFYKGRELKSPLVDIFKKLMLFVGIYGCSSAHPSLLTRGHSRPSIDQEGDRFTQRRICHRG
jgi:hypothetical protein